MHGPVTKSEVLRLRWLDALVVSRPLTPSLFFDSSLVPIVNLVLAKPRSNLALVHGSVN